MTSPVLRIGYVISQKMSMEPTLNLSDKFKLCQMYGSGEGLCNKMWGEAFYYSSDTDNCTVMVFNSSMINPNIRLTFPEILPGVSGNGSIQSTMVYGSMLIIMLLFAANI